MKRASDRSLKTDFNEPLVILNLENEDKEVQQLMIYSEKEAEIDKSLNSFYKNSKDPLKMEEKRAIKNLILKKIKAIKSGSVKDKEEKSLEKTNKKNKPTTEGGKEKVGKKHPATTGLTQKDEAKKSKSPKQDHMERKEEIESKQESELKAKYKHKKVRTKEEMRELRNKNSNENTFERLWYDATEGKKQRQQTYDEVFKLLYPFQPNLHESDHQFRRDLNQEHFYQRLCYTKTKQLKPRSSSRRAGDRSHVNTSIESCSVIKRSSDAEFEEHKMKRSYKQVAELYKKAEESAKSVGFNQPMVIEEKRFAQVRQDFSVDFAQISSCTMAKRLHKAEVHQTRQEQSPSRSSFQCLGENSMKGVIDENAAEFQGMLVTKRYKKLLQN